MPENPQVSSKAALSLENSNTYNKRRFKNNAYYLDQILHQDELFQKFSDTLNKIPSAEKSALQAALKPQANEPFKFKPDQLLLLQKLFGNLLSLENKAVGLLLTQDELKDILTALPQEVREKLFADDAGNSAADARARLLLHMMADTEKAYSKLKKTSGESQTQVEHEKYLASLQKILDEDLDEEPSKITRKSIQDTLTTPDPDDDEKLSPRERYFKKLRLKEMYENVDVQFFLRNEWVRTPENVRALGEATKWGNFNLGDKPCMALKVQENYVRRGISRQESSFLLIDIQNAPFSLDELCELVRLGVKQDKIPPQKNSTLLEAAVAKENPFHAIQFLDGNGKRYALYANIVGADSFYFQKIELEGDAEQGYTPKLIDNHFVVSYLNENDLKAKVETQKKPYEGLTLAQALPRAIKELAIACDFYAISDVPMPEDAPVKKVLIEKTGPASIYDQEGLFLLFDDTDVRLQELIFNGDFTAQELLDFFKQPGGLSDAEAIELFDALKLSGVDLVINKSTPKFVIRSNKLQDTEKGVTVFGTAGFNNLKDPQKQRFNRLFTPENRQKIQEKHQQKAAERNKSENAASRTNYNKAFERAKASHAIQKQARDTAASYQGKDKQELFEVGFRVNTYFGLLQQAAEKKQTAETFKDVLKAEAGLKDGTSPEALNSDLSQSAYKLVKGEDFFAEETTPETQMRCILTSLQDEMKTQRAKPGQSSFFEEHFRAVERMLQTLGKHEAALKAAEESGETLPASLTFADFASELTDTYEGLHRARNTLFLKQAAEGKLHTGKNGENLLALTNAFMLTGSGNTTILEVGFVPNQSADDNSKMNLLKLGIESCLQDHQGKIFIPQEAGSQRELTMEYKGLGALGHALYLFKEKDETINARDENLQASIETALIHLGARALRKARNLSSSEADHSIPSLKQAHVFEVHNGEVKPEPRYPDPATVASAAAKDNKPTILAKK